MSEAEERQPILVPRIFVSHSGQDDAFGTRLVKDLRNAFRDDNAVWYDRLGGLEPGDTWWEAIVQQITARGFFLLIMSPDAFASNWVKAEYQIAWQQRNDNGNKHIIPLYYRECKISPDIASIQYTDFRGCDDAANPSIYLDALDKLLRTLQDRGMRTGMEQVSKELPIVGNITQQEEPRAIIQQQLPLVEDAYRRGDWHQVIERAQRLTERVTGIIPSELYEMQGLAALHERNNQLAEEALQFFLAQQGDIERHLAILLKYIQLLNRQNQGDLVRDYTYKLMDSVRDDPYWFKRVLYQLALLIPSDVGIVSDVDLPPSYLDPAHTYRGHTKEVYAIAWSPDNRYIASAGKDHTLQIWEPTNRRSGAIVCCQHVQTVRDVAWRPLQQTDGSWRYLAAACDDHTVYIWGIRLQDGRREQFAPLKGHHSSVRSVVWSPDGRFLASGSDDGTVRVWDLPGLDAQNRSARDKKGPFCIFKHGGWVNAVAWSPYKKGNEYTYLASAGSDKTVKVWDIDKALEADTKGCIYTYRGHQKAVYDLIWSPNGRTLASASGDKTVQIWEYKTGNHGATYQQHSDVVVSLARSPYGRRIVSSSKNSFHVWYAATGDIILSNPFNVGWIRKVTWSPDGLSIALTAGEHHTVQVWRVTSAVPGLL